MNNSDALTDSLTNNKGLKNYNRWIYENIRTALGEKIIEIGCGLGAIIDFMISKNNEITGVDISDEYIKFLKKYYKKNKNIRIIKSDILDLPVKVKKNYFDSVVMINVLEHIKDDDKAIKIIRKLLKKGGSIALMVPAFNILFGPLDKNVGHFRRYEKKQLEQLLKKNNFEIKEIYYMNFVGFFGWLLNVRIFKRNYTPKNQSFLFDRLIVPILKQIERHIKPPVGQSIIAIAIKK